MNTSKHQNYEAKKINDESHRSTELKSNKNQGWEIQNKRKKTRHPEMHTNITIEI